MPFTRYVSDGIRTRKQGKSVAADKMFADYLEQACARALDAGEGVATVTMRTGRAVYVLPEVEPGTIADFPSMEAFNAFIEAST